MRRLEALAAGNKPQDVEAQYRFEALVLENEQSMRKYDVIGGANDHGR